MIANNLADYLADDTLTLPKPADMEQAIGVILEQFTQEEGATFNCYFGLIQEQPLYAVSIYPERTRLLETKQLPRTILQTFWRENVDLLSDPRCCIGVWYDVEEDVTFIDVSVVLVDERQAVQLGQLYNQRGIFSFERRVVIDTGGSGAEPDNLLPIEQRLPAPHKEETRWKRREQPYRQRFLIYCRVIRLRCCTRRKPATRAEVACLRRR